MVSFSLIAAFISVILASFFSGFVSVLTILLFVFLLVLNCECVTANACEEDQTSVLLMAVICSALVVMLCVVVVSTSINNYLCSIGLLNPDLVHPAAPALTVLLTAVLYRQLLRRAKENRLTVQKYGRKLMRRIDTHTYNPRLKRIRRMMIQEGTLTERLPDEDE